MKLDPREYLDKLPVNENNQFKRIHTRGDFFQMFQDPTSLGFKLFFINIQSGGISNSIDLKNALTKGQSIFQEENTIETFDTVNSHGLFGSEKSPNSALYYLKSIGDEARFSMLIEFKSLLSKLNTEYPWYFQSIEGLSEAWSRDYSKPKIKKELTIQCLESIDLRITALMDLYRKIAYDWQNRRAILPDNLRKFDLSIKVYDVRNFRKAANSTFGIPTEYEKSKHKINSQFLGNDYTDTTQVTFNFSHCEFLPDESGNMFGTVANNSYENATQSIKIGYENIQEDNIYRSLVSLGNIPNFYYVKDYLRKELEIINGFDNSILEQNNDVFGSLIDNIATNVSNAAANTIKSKVNSLFIGNVYGFSPSSLLTSGPNAIINAPRKIPNALGNAFGKGKN